MVVVILLLWSILGSLFSFTGLVRQRFEVIVIRLVPRVHDSDTLSSYFKIRLVSNFVGLCCLFWRKELDESKIFVFACELIFDLSYISDWHHSLEGLQQHVFLNLSDNGSSDHQTAVLGRLLFEITGRWLSAITESTVDWFWRLASIAFVSSCKIFVIAFLAVPIVGKSKVNFSNRIVLYFEVSITEADLSL